MNRSGRTSTARTPWRLAQAANAESSQCRDWRGFSLWPPLRQMNARPSASRIARSCWRHFETGSTPNPERQPLVAGQMLRSSGARRAQTRPSAAASSARSADPCPAPSARSVVAGGGRKPARPMKARNRPEILRPANNRSRAAAMIRLVGMMTAPRPPRNFDYPANDGRSLHLVCVENVFLRLTLEHGRELPREIDGVLHAAVHALARERRHQVGGVAGEKYASAPPSVGDTGMEGVDRPSARLRTPDTAFCLTSRRMLSSLLSFLRSRRAAA